jgi:hypothetical protein
MQASVKAVRESLSESDQPKFDDAMQQIARGLNSFGRRWQES